MRKIMNHIDLLLFAALVAFGSYVQACRPDIEALFLELGGQDDEREGSRVLVRLFGDRRVFHRLDPEPVTDKGALVSSAAIADSGGGMASAAPRSALWAAGGSLCGFAWRAG